jgi:hypothetical protein
MRIHTMAFLFFSLIASVVLPDAHAGRRGGFSFKSSGFKSSGFKSSGFKSYRAPRASNYTFKSSYRSASP